MGLFLLEAEPKKAELTTNKEQEQEAYIDPSVEVTKREAKNNAKALVKKKFVVGKKYMLRQKSVCGSREIIKKYVCKKFIYTVKDELLNILILKQVEGPKGTIFTLNRNDCKRYHIKYEPGLQVFSMEFNWIPCK